ncbi:leucine-rich_repeat domain-containing protein [Hexamita inflata]|uniref:Leucine-rich repeat domain-containing protein n=1 Tax=Hexamita inflata TaxID=28002 RepID=A0AA86NKG6_9EUKA|nr:leucine-rich repeat domain-containing protein [Hexamita inflata]CAI9921470.1 leucine-rich repeat domain-containing protein [Hexamita inflata]
MQPNHEIQSKEDLLSHFGSSKQLEILELEQMENLLTLNALPEVWEDASNRNLLSFSQEFVQQTKEVTFDNKWIKHIYLISFLTYLTELSLYNNKVSDISAVSKLKNLKKLDLSCNSIEDISALQSLLNLTHLHLFQNNLTSYTVALPNLVYLSLSYNKLQDKSGLQHSPKLERLYLSLTETTDLRTIPHQLFGLKVQYLSDNNITEIPHLSNFVDLLILKLGNNNQLQNIGPLKFCTQLTKLNIFETSVAEIWPLQFMKKLKSLYMYHTLVVGLLPLQYLQTRVFLKYIFASYSCVIDISPLLVNLIQRIVFLGQQNYCRYTQASLQFLDFQVSTPELKFYSKILKVHSSHKQIRNIMNDNKITKLRTSLTLKKNAVSTVFDNCARKMNTQLELLSYFLQSSNTQLQ